MPTTRGIRVPRALTLALLVATPAVAARAQFVVPTAYTATPRQGTGHGGSYNYFDDGGTQLTDGILGGNAWFANLGNGPAQEWVGWLTVNPSFVFTFGAPVSITAVQVGFNRGSGGVNLPATVTIGGQSFSVAADALAPDTRGFLTFDVADLTTTSLAMSIARSDSWVFVDEVRFVGAQTNVVPEPGTYALLATGLGALGLVARSRGRPRG